MDPYLDSKRGYRRRHELGPRPARGFWVGMLIGAVFTAALLLFVVGVWRILA